MARQFQAGADVQGSVRSRIGIAFDRFLIYGTGGVAFTGFNTTITDTTGFFTRRSRDQYNLLEHARRLDRGRWHRICHH
jgi:opacity protein-like surface antigen